ncbi:DUF1992 domain-containing protein [Mesobacillus subterraneus]|uniref:DUF1992 domain-containing protein n=1 Tax=Mesobacillus subterraneus TaxID=285983 RepID=A0A427TQL2_9BACI|nr:DUF1992 domain-containing protein [Mesobacillus subterraneus]RSD26714.1 DUF1992 domain-containing protein [Mesobacillus subterraneus]
MDFSMVVSEDRIKRAYKDGEFENLPGYGKPLNLEDLSAIPEELRMAYKMLQNAGFSPEEQKLRQEVMSIEDLIRTCENPEEKDRLNQELSHKLLKYNKIMSSRGVKTNSSLFKNYERKIEKKLL